MQDTFPSNLRRELQPMHPVCYPVDHLTLLLDPIHIFVPFLLSSKAWLIVESFRPVFFGSLSRFQRNRGLVSTFDSHIWPITARYPNRRMHPHLPPRPRRAPHQM